MFASPVLRLVPSRRAMVAALCALTVAALAAVMPTLRDGVTTPALPETVSLPVDFVPNQGQWAAGAQFVARQGAMSATLGATALTVRTGEDASSSVTLKFVGASAATTLVGEEQRAGTYNFVVGDNPDAWRSGVPSFAAVRYSGLYPGIDVRVRDGKGPLEYDALVAPGADLNDLVIRVAEATGISITASGELVIGTDGAALRQSAPVAWEVLADGTRQPVDSRFRLVGDNGFGFAVDRHDASLPLVIDPGIDWATYIGGSGDETLGGMVRVADGSGDLIVGGTTRSPEFPASGRITGFDTPFVARVSADGTSLVYATYFGGSNVHTVSDVGVDGAGNALVVGDTNSKDFPTTPGAVDSTPPGNPALPSDFGYYDGYAIRFNASGGGPLMATYLSGDAATGATNATRAAYDPAGNPIVAGWTTAANFPTTVGAFDRTRSTARDVFVTRLSPDGTQRQYSTLFGGDGGTDVFDLVVGPDGAVNLTGQAFAAATGTASLPTTTDAIDRVNTVGTSGTGWHDAFFARLRLNGGGASDLEYSTFIGGDEWANEAGNGIALTPGDPTEVTLSGFTRAGTFPTTAGALLRTHYGPVQTSMGWVARFRVPGPGQGTLAWSTFFGAPGNQSANDVVVDPQGNPIIVGGTATNNPPTTDGAYDRTPEGVAGAAKKGDGYVAKLNATGSAILYSSLIGASGGDTATEIVHAGGNSVVLAGVTTSVDFPVSATGWDRVYAGDGKASGSADPGTLAEDIWLSKFTLDRGQPADTTPPPAPTISWPTQGAVFTSSSTSLLPVAYDWSDVADPSGIAAYHVQVSPNPTFTNDVASESNGWFEPWSPASFAVRSYCCGENGNFSMRVQAMDAAGNLGPWSEVRTFQIVAGSTSTATPVAPTLTSPANNGRYRPGAITLAWNHTANTTSYTVEVDTTTAFNSSNKITATGLTINRRDVTISTTGTRYWRVRAFNGTVAGPWSSTRNFQLRTGSAAPPVPAPGTELPPAPGDTPGTGLKSLVVTPESPFGAVAATGTVTLHEAAPAGGAVVSLASQLPARVSVPASVTVPAGQTSATFTANVSDGRSIEQLGVSGSYGGSSHGYVVIAYPGEPTLELYSMTTPTTSIGGGTTAQVTVALQPTFVAGPGGAIVHLGSTNPAVLTAPTSVTIPQGANSATFTVTTQSVTQASSVTLVASRSVTKRLTFQLLGASSLSALAVSPNPAVGSGGSTGTVTLSSPAPSGGKVVALSSSDTRWVVVPASVTVPTGATSATFAIATTAATDGLPRFATVFANADGVERWVSLNVNPGAGGGGGGGGTLAAPTLQAPSSGARVSPGSITFDWSDVSTATGYTIEIDDSTSFGAPLVATQTVTASTWVTSTLPTRKLWWRVRANGPSGTSAWSAVRELEIK